MADRDTVCLRSTPKSAEARSGRTPPETTSARRPRAGATAIGRSLRQRRARGVRSPRTSCWPGLRSQPPRDRGQGSPGRRWRSRRPRAFLSRERPRNRAKPPPQPRGRAGSRRQDQRAYAGARAPSHERAAIDHLPATRPSARPPRVPRALGDARRHRSLTHLHRGGAGLRTAQGRRATAPDA